MSTKKGGGKGGKRTNEKVNIVVDEIQSILQLAKKGRKKLKPDEIERCGNIDAKKLWGLIRDWTEGCKIPIDVLRIIFRYMEPKDYLRLGSRLCKKMNGYVKEDLIVIEADIHFSVSKYKKNGGSSSTSSFYTLRNVIFSKDLLNKKMQLIFKHKYGSIEELKRKYYDLDCDYTSNKRMYISVGYKTKVHDVFQTIYLYDDLKVKTSKYGFGSEKFENKCNIDTYWVPEWEKEEIPKTYEKAKNSDIFSHMILTF